MRMRHFLRGNSISVQKTALHALVDGCVDKAYLCSAVHLIQALLIQKSS